VRRRRAVLLLLGATLIGLAALLGRPAAHLWRTARADRDDRVPAPAGQLLDASRLDATPVAGVIEVAADVTSAKAQIADLLTRARRENRSVSIAGARHSMGGQSLVRDGYVLDMLPLRAMSLDAAGKVLTVGAGARWSDVLAFLDPRGLSVAVMQSDARFSVGGSLSVGAHGWQAGRPPVTSTARALTVVRADGTAVRCSRTEEPELFSLVLGGYGLFGVIVEAELEVVRNEAYRPERRLVPVERYVETLDGLERAGGSSDVEMAYGRLSIVPGALLEEGIVTVYHRTTSTGPLRPTASGIVDRKKRLLFRGSVGSDYGKRLRWQAETHLARLYEPSIVTRNQLLDARVEEYENVSNDSTDILHEYFVPPDRFVPFVARLRAAVRRSGADLLNVTVREVERDDASFLRYADRRLLALVCLFNQRRTAEAEAKAQVLTRELIDGVLSEGGRYYLPYRLHATPEQLRRAYPQVDAFFAAKRRLDPDLLFRNAFFDRYGMP